VNLTRIWLSLTLACLTATCAYSQTPEANVPSQSASAFVSPTAQLRKTVGLLQVIYIDDGVRMESSGTCFFVVYLDKRVAGGKGGFIYLVTNRHMAIPGIENGHPYPVLGSSLRLNERGANAASNDDAFPANQPLRWYFPADDSIDLAVMPFKPDESRYDYVAIPTSIFATRDIVEQQHVAEGDAVLFTGYFYQFPGMKKFQPILREGVLAMIPDEPMETTLKKPGSLYLAEVHVFGGNSGSPLIVNLGGLRNGAISAGYDYRLLGIVSGYYHEDANLTLTVATTYKGKLEQNSGISMIVPVDKLKELLDSPALQAQRDAEIAVTGGVPH
jgi:hypothetical protein